MSVLLSRYLKDFSAVVTPPPGDFSSEIANDFAQPDLLAAPVEEPVDVEAIRDEAYAEGHETAERELAEKHRQALEAMEEAHREELAAIRQKYEDEIAEHIGQAFQQMTTAVSGAVEAAVVRVLSPLIEEKIALQTAAAFASKVAEEIKEGTAVRLQVAGPDRLLETVKTRLAAIDASVDFRETSEIELSFQMGDSVLVTRLAGVVEAMEGLMNE
ncbi:hypothetical protein G6N76_13035 [Rhizobium daejeonense]|uniref:Flagellar assembly protein FliH/Type III secretion system HrpE domain-containing protein n=1 Tax=Rhizobium daejeonense TaxID=240521 RepID=A0A6M1S2X7_9HYPH|nr:hypothetical protein [Rhizobium daejeonense]NGO64591.1 hypothetical protein [Rhizobium daejeonense]